MNLFSLFGLDLAAVLTNSEPLSDVFNARDGHSLTDQIAFAKVDFTEGCLFFFFLAKREFLVVHLIGAGNVLCFVYVNKELLAVEDARPVITFV